MAKNTDRSSIPARPRLNFSAGSHKILLGQKTVVMGIVNTTPDSFSGDGVRSVNRALDHALRQIELGADILDIGGESARPGAETISAQEEIRRTIPLIKKLRKVVKVPISVDTYKGLTARHALDEGASIINVIQGFNPQQGLLQMVAKYKAGIVLMHMRGNSRTMQKLTRYANLIKDITRELRGGIEKCLEFGIKSDNIIIDPGICFAKEYEQNLCILRQLREFAGLKKPILIGTSRKSFIGKILSGATPEERVEGTIASCVVGAMNGAHIVRVHDVGPVVKALRVTDAIINQKNSS